MQKGYTVTNKDILAYYDLHGGSDGVFGQPVGDAQTKNGILYQDFADKYMEIIRSTSHLILEFAKDGGFVNAANF